MSQSLSGNSQSYAERHRARLGKPMCWFLVAAISAPASCYSQIYDVLYVGSRPDQQAVFKNYDSSSFNVLRADVSGKGSVFLLGDKLAFDRNTIRLTTRLPEPTKDLYIICRELTLGPAATISLNGEELEGDSANLNGGNLYIFAEKILLDGYDGRFDRMVAPLIIERRGAKRQHGGIEGVAGVVRIFSDSIAITDAYQMAKFKSIESSSNSTKKIPSSTLKMFARTFSSGNSIHQTIKNNDTVTWGAIGAAYKVWMSQERPGILAARELGLTLTFPGDHRALSQPDHVGDLSSVGGQLSAPALEQLGEWYRDILRKSAANAEGAFARAEYQAANEVVRNALRLTKTAPTTASNDGSYLESLRAISDVDRRLASMQILESFDIPQTAAPPIPVLTIRDLASKKIGVFPNLIVLNAFRLSNSFKVGFYSDESTSGIGLSLRGRLSVDPTILEAVRRKYPGFGVEVYPLVDEISYGMPDLGLSGLLSSDFKVSEGGIIEMKLVFREEEFVTAVIRLGQPYGIGANLRWSHRNNAKLRSDSPLMVNLSLKRTDIGLSVAGTAIVNTFDHPVDVHYVSDRGGIHIFERPIRVLQNQELPYACIDPNCFVPGVAIRHEISTTDPMALLQPLSRGSVVRTIRIENVLDSSTALGGTFQHADLLFTFSTPSDALPQQSGPLRFDRRGASGATQVIRFLTSSDTDSSTLTVVGRAFWGTGTSYQDISAVLPNPQGTVLLSKDWFSKKP